MKEVQFIEKRQAEWDAWDRYLDADKKKRAQAATLRAEALPFTSLPGAFRRLCRDLALARDRQYSARLVEDLHQRVLAAHQRVYGAMPARRGAALAFIAGGFPRLVRAEWRSVLAAFLLFFVPLTIMLVAPQFVPESAYLVLSPEQAEQMEEMYAPGAKHLGRPRAASTEWEMWGYYIANNVRIGFQCFAGGIAFGIGAVFFMVFNGLSIGAVAGHLTQIGYIDTFWGFVSGHSAFELSGIVLAGAAGLKLGHALIAPGRRERLAALTENAAIAIRLLYGAATLIFLAAFIEAFWSPRPDIPLQVKYSVGIAMWVLTWAYLLLAGRSRRAA